VRRERAVMRCPGEYLGSGECCVHPGTQKTPRSPDTPAKNLACGIREHAGEGGAGGTTRSRGRCADGARAAGTNVPLYRACARQGRMTAPPGPLPAASSPVVNVASITRQHAGPAGRPRDLSKTALSCRQPRPHSSRWSGGTSSQAGWVPGRELRCAVRARACGPLYGQGELSAW